jgi:hypothetical protein
MGRDAPIQGPFNEAMYHKEYDFDEDTLNTDFWAHTGTSNGGTIAIVSGANGILRLTTDTGADDNVIEIESAAMYFAQQACKFECRYKIDNITTVGYFIGFADDKIATNDQIKVEVASGVVTARGTTPDLVGFCFDTDATTDKLWCVASKADADGDVSATSTITALAPVNSVYEVIGVELDILGNATFYRNGAVVGSQALAVTVGQALRLYAGMVGRTAAATRNLDIDVFKVWQNRGETSTVVY